MWQVTLMTVYYHLFRSLMTSVKRFPTIILFLLLGIVSEPGCPVTKLLTINLRSTAPRMLGSRGTPSQFVIYGLKNMCAKFDAFTRFVTIFPLTDRTIIGSWLIPFTFNQSEWVTRVILSLVRSSGRQQLLATKKQTKKNLRWVGNQWKLVK